MGGLGGEKQGGLGGETQGGLGGKAERVRWRMAEGRGAGAGFSAGGMSLTARPAVEEHGGTSAGTPPLHYG